MDHFSGKEDGKFQPAANGLRPANLISHQAGVPDQALKPSYGGETKKMLLELNRWPFIEAVSSAETRFVLGSRSKPYLTIPCNLMLLKSTS